MGKSSHGSKQPLVFDPKERVDFVKGFSKRKKERQERAKKEQEVKDRELRRVLRQKRKAAMKSKMEHAACASIDVEQQQQTSPSSS